jgi:C4-dicarboxylate transporter DctQ subunit
MRKSYFAHTLFVRKKLLKYLHNKLNNIEDFLILFSGVSIFIVMILTSFQIISRVMGYPWPGYLELSELSISIFAFLGVAYAQRLDSHIRMELMVSSLY